MRTRTLFLLALAMTCAPTAVLANLTLCAGATLTVRKRLTLTPHTNVTHGCGCGTKRVVPTHNEPK